MESLDELKRLVKRDGLHKETTRQFVQRFGAERRGKNTVAEIRAWLEAASFQTVPDFENNWFDGEIQIIDEASHKSARQELKSRETVLRQAIQPLRIEILDAANQVPISVRKEESIEVAFTRMLTRDFSQLPVMDDERTVKGMVTISSLVRRQLKPLEGPVSKYMQAAEVVEHDASLLDVLPRIIQKDAIVVRAKDGRILGPVTTADLSMEFQKMASPFLILQEIESRLRAIIGALFSGDEIAQIIPKPNGENRNRENLYYLTVSEYLTLLHNPKAAKLFARPLAKAEIMERLETVRTLRNNVMHFAPEPFSSSNIDALRQTSEFLKILALNRIEAEE